MTIKRRTFLSHVAAGSAVLAVPGFLAGCGVQQATAIAQPTPENPFMDWFGVDQATVARVMSELTANGADAADLYFQHSLSNRVNLEDGIVGEASSRIRQGVGLRVVIGDQVTKSAVKTRLAEPREGLYPPPCDPEGKLEQRTRFRSKPAVTVVDGFFHLRYVENCGGAFGFLSTQNSNTFRVRSISLPGA